MKDTLKLTSFRPAQKKIELFSSSVKDRNVQLSEH